MIKRFLPSFIFLIIPALLLFAVWWSVYSSSEPDSEVPAFAARTEPERLTVYAPQVTESAQMAEPATEAVTEIPTATYADLRHIDLQYIEGEGLYPGRFAELEEVIRRHGRGVSVFYKDIISGDTFFYNELHEYFIASIIKAPYVMHIYRRAMKYGLCMDERIYTYRQEHHWGGTGRIQHMQVGTVFTLGELLHHAIRYSDNVAMNIMMSVFPRAEYTEYAAELGLPHLEKVRNITNGRVCAKCAAVYIKAIHEFIEEQNEFSAEFKEHLLNTTNVMIRADYPIARKYGWATDSFHDFGIIYNSRGPYLLAILSDRGSLAGDFPMFTEISRAVERHHNSRFEGRVLNHH